MFKDITDVMLARAYAVDFLFQNVPFEPERPRRHLLRKSLAWLLRAGGRALTWTGDRVAV
jgi:hypothetical protein